MEKYDNNYFRELFHSNGYTSLEVFSVSIASCNREKYSKGYSHFFNVYDTSLKGCGLGYIGTFEYSKVNDSIAYICGRNTNEFTSLYYDELFVLNDVKSLIDKFNEMNKSRIFPSYCYDPLLSPAYQMKEIFSWYVGLFGYEQSYTWMSHTLGDVSANFELKNVYGENVSNIMILMKERNDNFGEVIRVIGNGFSYVTSKFEGIDGMITAVNNIVGFETLCNASKYICDTEKFIGTMDGNVNGCTLSNYNIIETNKKNAVKHALEVALKNLQ